MSGLLGAIGISESGANAMQTWIDTSAGNIANIDDEAPVGNATYAAQTPFIVPTAEQGTSAGVGGGQGVEVERILLGTTAGVVEEDPTDPLANAEGEVAVPNITLGNQLVNSISAEETYGANTLMIERATQSYQDGLTIGEGT